MTMHTLTVHTQSHDYPIFILAGQKNPAGQLDLASQIIPFIKGKQVLIVTNDVVAPFYLDALEGALKTASFDVATCVLPDGEHHKNQDSINRIYDVLLELTDPKLVIFELDIAWITAAGKDPLAYFRNYPGRFEVWHMKDLTPEKQDATLGEGIIDFKPILAEARTAGMKYWFVEQDHCRTHTPMESIRISREYYLKRLLK